MPKRAKKISSETEESTSKRGKETNNQGVKDLKKNQVICFEIGLHHERKNAGRKRKKYCTKFSS